MSAHAYSEDQLVEQPAIGLFAELGWPRMEPSLGFWQWPPRDGLSNTRAGLCYPWYMCAARAVGLDDAAALPDLNAIVVPVVALHVHFHLCEPGWDAARQARLLLALGPSGPLRFVVEPSPEPPPLDEFYSASFHRQAAQCLAVQAIERGRRGDNSVDFACDRIGELTNFCCGPPTYACNEKRSCEGY